MLLDRNVDTITPFLSQLTYEGLIEECVGIKDCLIEVDAKKINSKAAEAQRHID